MKNFFIAILCLFSSFCQAHLKDSTTVSDTLEYKRFEFSFGQSMLFISNSKEIDLLMEDAIILPTSAVLFFAEFRPFKILRLPLFFNLPTESKQFLLDSGVVVNERVNPTFGGGIQFKIFKFKIDDQTTIEWEMGPLVSFLMTKDENLKFAPIGAGRLRIIKKRNFVMYIGTSYSLGIDSWGLIYGTGFLF